MSNEITIRSGTRIGNMSAEADDEFLFSCFEDHPVLSEISDRHSSRTFILGGTGSGKTSILKMIEKQNRDSVSLNIHEMAMSYIANNDVIQFLDSIDVRLDFFFQALWRHVICIEYIRLSFQVGDKDKSNNIFNRLLEIFERGDRKKRALKYLDDWHDKFWITMDEVVRELTDKLGKDVKLELGLEIEKFLSKAGYARGLSQENNVQLQQRTKKFVEDELLTELAGVQNMLSEYKGNSPNTYYILIDQLDENWVDSRIRFRLIRSLIEALKSLRRIENLKVIVAVRSDLLQKVVDETKEDGFQSEKYEDYFIRINWTSAQLKYLVNKRINYLYRKKYTKENVFFEDIFRGKISKKEPIDYIIERTLLRPRDVIDFVNTALQTAEGKSNINQSLVHAAEKLYSRRRLTAVIEEWAAVYPALEPCLDLLKARRSTLQIDEWKTSDIVNDIFDGLVIEETYQKDCLFEMTQSMDGEKQVSSLVNELFARYYKVGAAGLKLLPQDSYLWAHSGNHVVDSGMIGSGVKARIHPMFHSALAVRD